MARRHRNQGILACLFVGLLVSGAYLSFSPLISMRLYHHALFFPWKYPSGYYDEREIDSLMPEDVWFPSYHNGAKLHGWYYTTPGATRGVVLHHGQGANITVLRNWAKIFLDCRCNVLLYDYEGYGKSEGEPSIDALRADGLAAFDFFSKHAKIPSRRIVNCGESLGTGVAAYVTECRATAGLILFSPYDSLIGCAQQRYPVLNIYPRFLFPSVELECRSCLTRAHPPVLLIHGTDDFVIPVSNSDELYRIGMQPKLYIRLQGAAHDPLNWDYHTAIQGFLNSLSAS